MHAAPFLIVAVTGRALAASAARAGHSVVVLDCFADRDTREVASECRAVARPGTLRFDQRALLAAAGLLASPDQSSGLVFGAGFEGRTELLARLAAGRSLLGNSPAVVKRVRDPRRFFPLLDRLGIRHPQVRFTRPADPTGWLEKSPGGAGGAQVRLVASGTRRRGSYFQRLQSGRVLSVLFLADGRRASLVGFNEQWTSPARPGLPFLYGGAVGSIDLPAKLTADIATRLDALVATTGVIGLNGFDFLLEGDTWSVLELNPRPTATAELYDPDHPEGLFELHRRSCLGSLPEAPAPHRVARAHAIVHATTGWDVTGDFRFPAWCRDIPIPGTRVAEGDPICTVHAEDSHPEVAVALVHARRSALERSVGEAAAAATAGA
jgi:uncharacterized protein